MVRPNDYRTRLFRVSSLVAIAWSLILHTSLATASPVVPASVSDTLTPYQFIVVEKTVQTPVIRPLPDIVILCDTTGDMESVIPSIQASIPSIMSDVADVTDDPNFAVAEYRDVGDAFTFFVNIGLTDNQDFVNAAVSSWSAGSGGDTPECQLNALNELATGAVSYRTNSNPLIVWFGNASGHDPCNGVTEAAATAALVAEGITVIAIDVNTGDADGLDNTGQASRIATATGGQFLSLATPDDVTDAILEGLSDLPISVIPQAVGCDPLDVSFDPVSMTVTSGEPVIFDETIAVPNDASLEEQTIECTVEFRDDEGSLLVVDDEDAIQDITIEIIPLPNLIFEEGFEVE